MSEENMTPLYHLVPHFFIFPLLIGMPLGSSETSLSLQGINPIHKASAHCQGSTVVTVKALLQQLRCSFSRW